MTFQQTAFKHVTRIKTWESCGLREGNGMRSQLAEEATGPGDQDVDSASQPDETVALYTGGTRSGVFRGGERTRPSHESIKANVRNGSIRILMGTDAALEGLNL